MIKTKSKEGKKEKGKMMKGERRGASRAEASERRIWKNKDKEHTKNERGQREGREGRGGVREFHVNGTFLMSLSCDPAHLIMVMAGVAVPPHVGLHDTICVSLPPPLPYFLRPPSPPPLFPRSPLSSPPLLHSPRPRSLSARLSRDSGECRAALLSPTPSDALLFGRRSPSPIPVTNVWRTAFLIAE